MLTPPEIREVCHREVQALSRVMVLPTREEKRVAQGMFRENITGKVFWMGCVPLAVKEVLA